MHRQKTVLITAGPTIEYIDPVRFITNASSGKLGYAIASMFSNNGWKVILVSGPVSIKKPQGVTCFNVETAEEMFKAVKKFFYTTDVFISTAAVCDFKPKKVSPQKIKKKSRLVLELVPTIDILEFFGKQKNDKQIVIGFALETDRKNALNYARAKLLKKNLDMIVLNTIETLGSDYIKPVLVYRLGKIEKIKKIKKYNFAKILYKRIEQLSKQKVCV
ncbi:MAG: phosphopantothenoylcysteine decarboxylase [Endomicrobia bacterium]|nr:phosphopantothenoylcysteine decarboxylase [Endomicrobiia bacterium]